MLDSASFLSSIASFRALSRADMVSASRTIFSMSASDRPPDPWIVTFCSLLVALSLADTLTMPLASMSKVTSICGTPRGAGGTPTRSNCPSSLLSAAISRSPCSTLMPTWVWLSAAVENTWLFFVGMVVLRLMRRVNTPPRVSIPRERGVTSNSRISFTSPRSTPPWMAAPSATTSSGLTLLLGSLLNSSFTICCTRGMRDMPPTINTSLISLVDTPASLIASLHGCLVRSRRGPTSASSLDRVTCTFKCFAPVASAVMKGRLISVLCVDESSIFAFSAASLRRCTASLSPVRSMPCSFLNSSTSHIRIWLSISSPPRNVSPFVDFTSNTPPDISRIEISKVPPPRSYTATMPSFLSTPYDRAAAVGSLMMRRTSRPAILPASLVAWR
mmetsp:Transcript_37007/g.62319  ORF Transcript_37007/g.62319 Transcript_37007/m.62319 type:complete len:388 (+) Transcript_37007:1130-2293(+)